MLSFHPSVLGFFFSIWLVPLSTRAHTHTHASLVRVRVCVRARACACVRMHQTTQRWRSIGIFYHYAIELTIVKVARALSLSLSPPLSGRSPPLRAYHQRNAFECIVLPHVTAHTRNSSTTTAGTAGYPMPANTGCTSECCHMRPIRHQIGLCLTNVDCCE